MADLAVFICYRRADASAEAGRLYEALRRRYGRDHLFMDVGIAPGDDWVEAIESAIGGCDVLLAVIGREWLGATDEEGRLRLGQPYDRVRLEIETALRLGKPVIPVLVEESSMPDDQRLPESLRPLHRRQAIRVSHATFERDFAALLSTLRTIERKKKAVVMPPPALAAPSLPVAATLVRPVEALVPAADTAPRASRSAVPIAAIAGVVAVVALVALAYIYASVLSLKEPGTTGEPSATLGVDGAQAELLSHVPEAIRNSCSDHEPAGGEIAMVECSIDDGAPFVKYLLYPDAGTLHAEFTNWVASIEGEPTEGGNCADTSRWPAMSSATAAGQELCGNYGDPHILWTDERYLVFGRAWGGSSADDLYAFYRDLAGQLVD